MSAKDLDLGVLNAAAVSASDLAWLKQTGLLQDLRESPEALMFFAKFLLPETYKAGAEIVSEGRHDSRVYFLVAGAVEILKTTPDGDAFKVASLGAESFPYMGEGALLHDEARGSTIRATTTCRCLYLTRQSFEEFCQERPEWGFPIMKYIALQLSNRLRKASKDFVMTYQALIQEIRGH